jgi:hypothetical protein
MQENCHRYPTAFAQWLRAIDFALGPKFEVAIIGDIQDTATQEFIHTLWHYYQPRLIASVSSYPPDPACPAFLKDRPLQNNLPTAYVCQGFVCREPVNTSQRMKEQLELII